MDMIEAGITAAGALAGGVVTYLATADQELPVRAAAVVTGGVMGGAVANVGYKFVQNNNPILQILGAR